MLIARGGWYTRFQPAYPLATSGFPQRGPIISFSLSFSFPFPFLSSQASSPFAHSPTSFLPETTEYSNYAVEREINATLVVLSWRCRDAEDTFPFNFLFTSRGFSANFCLRQTNGQNRGCVGDRMNCRKRIPVSMFISNLREILLGNS